MPKQAPNTTDEDLQHSAAPVRALWSGTITFGLVSIPVDLLTAVRPRQTAMKLVDSAGHALGRQYHCSKEGKKLANDELVRGYETDTGEMVVITDEEFAAVAPEMSADIDLRSFVPLEQIPALYFNRPYFLAPAGRSAKAYHLLAATMERTARVGIGSFVMRGHEYLVAIISDQGVLRADTLRYADEIRTPETIELPRRLKPTAAAVNKYAQAIDALTHDELDIAELEDREAEALQQLVTDKQQQGEDVIHSLGLEDDDAEAGAQVIDLMAVLRKSLSKSAVVRTADSGPPISLAERRAQRAEKAEAAPRTKRTTAKKKVAKRKTAKRAKKSAARSGQAQQK